MFKVITLSDSNYFDAGKLFFETRNVIKNNDIILYGPDLTNPQIEVLTNHNIEYEMVKKTDWDTKMQFLKFQFALNEISKDTNKKYEGFLSNDLDIFFVNDWSHLYKYDFDLCIVVRPTHIQKKIIRAYGCGGGFFFKHSSKELFEYAQQVVLNGGDSGVPEYDRIWKTLETGRPQNKTHYRTTHRWWVDQVFISSIVLRYIDKNKDWKFGHEPVLTDFNGFKIAFVSERFYNVLDSAPVIKKEKGIYIRHLKESGRIKLVGKEKAKVKEKLND
jgi:hypothetical protein